jgi:hypothetical protein
MIKETFKTDDTLIVTKMGRNLGLGIKYSNHMVTGMIA